jgi:hypothetical protein
VRAQSRVGSWLVDAVEYVIRHQRWVRRSVLLHGFWPTPDDCWLVGYFNVSVARRLANRVRLRQSASTVRAHCHTRRIDRCCVSELEVIFTFPEIAQIFALVHHQLVVASLHHHNVTCIPCTKCRGRVKHRALHRAQRTSIQRRAAEGWLKDTHGCVRVCVSVCVCVFIPLSRSSPEAPHNRHFRCLLMV